MIHILQVRLWLLALGWILAQDSLAAAEPESILPSPIPRARWSEDWSILGADDHRYESLSLPFKRIPTNKDGTGYLSFGGEFRLNYEMYDPSDRDLTDIGKQDVIMNRLVAHGDWHPGKRWRVFGQFGYTAATDRDGGAKAGDQSDLDIW